MSHAMSQIEQLVDKAKQQKKMDQKLMYEEHQRRKHSKQGADNDGTNMYTSHALTRTKTNEKMGSR